MHRDDEYRRDGGESDRFNIPKDLFDDLEDEDTADEAPVNEESEPEDSVGESENADDAADFDDDDDDYEYDDIDRMFGLDVYDPYKEKEKERERERKKRRKKKKPLALRIAIVVLIVILALVLVLGIAALIMKNQRPFNSGHVEEPGRYPDVVTSDDKGDVEYYMVCGFDNSEKLTDIIMVVCWDKKKNTANIMQIPRDTFISFDYSSTGKINSVYGNPRDGESEENGFSRVINEYFGLPVDHYVYFSVDSFKKIIDAVGGVEVDVPNNMSYGGVNLKAGKQVLDGAHAEVFMRDRYVYSTGDMGRVAAQRMLYAGLAEKIKTADASQLLEVFKQVKSGLITDMTVGQIGSSLLDIKDMNMQNINIFAVPGEAYDDYSKGYWNSLYTVHKKKLVEQLNEYMNPYGEKIKADDIKIKELANTGNEWIEPGDKLGNFKDNKSKNKVPSTTAVKGNADKN